MSNTTSLTEQEAVRLQKCQELEALGINPYPAEAFVRNATARGLQVDYQGIEGTFANVQVAGRLMGKRVYGALSFVTLEDATGTLQLRVRRDTLCPEEEKEYYDKVFKRLLDIGDIIGVKGHMCMTEKGTKALEVEALTLLSKAMTPLPAVKRTVTSQGGQVYNAFIDPEQRYRQRYVDLIVNPEQRAHFAVRAQVMRTIRRHFDALGCLEVETPVLQPIYGGAAARPFVTHHHTLDANFYLRISNELYLKRLIVGGYEGVYEFAKDFRNEGMSRFHNPEFSMVEVYVAYQDYYWMMTQTESLLEAVALAVHGSRQVQVGDEVIDFTPPFDRCTMAEVIQHFTCLPIEELTEEELRQEAKRLGVAVPDDAGEGKIIDALFGSCCEPHLIQPIFITDYPVAMSPLAKRHRSKEGLVERFELICNGKELCNAFSELNDPTEQRRRFEEQQALAGRGDDEAMMMDEDYLRALAYGMPPTTGMGMGIDRLLMLMTNAASIQDVLLFPQMRPKQ